MLAHDFRYGLGHLITGAFWHNLTDKSIHITTADSGWAKCGWGKFYGQWIAGAVNFIYDFDRFNAQKMLSMLAKYRVTSFCAPPTIYRFLIKEDFSGHDLSALQWATLRGRTAQPGGLQPVLPPHRRKDPRSLRPERDDAFARHPQVDGARARLHRRAQSPLPHPRGGRHRARRRARRRGRIVHRRFRRPALRPVHGLLQRPGTNALRLPQRHVPHRRHGLGG